MSQRRHIVDIIFWDVFDVLKVSHKKHLFWDVFESYLRCHTNVISFEMFLRGHWDVFLNGDLIEISQRHLMPTELPNILVKFPCRTYAVEDLIFFCCYFGKIPLVTLTKSKARAEYIFSFNFDGKRTDFWLTCL